MKKHQGLDAFTNALRNMTDPPCESDNDILGRCRHYDRCASCGLACIDFLHYVKSRSGWEPEDRYPDAKTYDKIYYSYESYNED